MNHARARALLEADDAVETRGGAHSLLAGKGMAGIVNAVERDHREVVTRTAARLHQCSVPHVASLASRG